MCSKHDVGPVPSPQHLARGPGRIRPLGESRPSDGHTPRGHFPGRWRKWLPDRMRTGPRQTWRGGAHVPMWRKRRRSPASGGAACAGVAVRQTTRRPRAPGAALGSASRRVRSWPCQPPLHIAQHRSLIHHCTRAPGCDWPLSRRLSASCARPSRLWRQTAQTSTIATTCTNALYRKCPKQPKWPTRPIIILKIRHDRCCTQNGFFYWPSTEISL